MPFRSPLPFLVCALLIGCGGTPDPDGFERHAGSLRSGDESLTSGEYTDAYAVEAAPGEWIEVAMTSSEIDPYLILRPPSCPEGGTCDEQVDNDDLIEGNGAFLWHRAGEGGSWTILATSAEPDEQGSYEIAYRVVPEGGAPATPNVALGGGRSEQGRLESGDRTLGSGEFADRYGFVGQAGDRVTVDLRSSEFDPYLIFQQPGGEQLENDDWEGASDHARVETTLPEDGTYSILVTTFRAGEGGSYTLQIAPGGPGGAADTTAAE